MKREFIHVAPDDHRARYLYLGNVLAYNTVHGS